MKLLWMVTWRDGSQHKTELLETDRPEEPTLQDSPIDLKMQHRAEFITCVILDTGRTFVLKNRYGVRGEVSR